MVLTARRTMALVRLMAIRARAIPMEILMETARLAVPPMAVALADPVAVLAGLRLVLARHLFRRPSRRTISTLFTAIR